MEQSQNSQQLRTEFLKALSGALSRNTLGHALLVSHRADAGAELLAFVRQFTQLLLCLGNTSVDQLASCKCESCRVWLSNPESPNHPDFVHCAPEASRSFAVDRVKEALASTQLSRALSERRVLWIEHSDVLSEGGGHSANALLKLLEEPRPNTYLILTTSRVEATLPTIRSRCQHLRLKTVSLAEDPKLTDDWARLLGAFKEGFSSPFLAALPGDDDGFWKDRTEALLELKNLYHYLWSQLWHLRLLELLPREGALRCLDFLDRLENLIRRVEGYAQAQIQWLGLRSQLSFGPQALEKEF